MNLIFTVLLIILAPLSTFASETVSSTVAAARSANSLPHCVDDSATIKEVVDHMKANSKTAFKYDRYKKALQSESDAELVARLAYAETLAANCESLNSEVASQIVRVITNRVKIRKGDVRGVVFQRDQFASSLNSYSDSKYKDFLCPRDSKLWNVIANDVSSQLSDSSRNASANTVNYFLYKHSPKWTKEPWKLTEDTSQTSPEIRACIKLFKVPNWK